MPRQTQEDGSARQVTLFAIDGAGNRSAPLIVTYSVDTVAPGIEITTVPPGPVILSDDLPPVTLVGAATDGGGVSQIYTIVEQPNGDFTSANVDWNPGAASAGRTASSQVPWTFALSLNQPGTYHLTIVAVDRAGNQSNQGPYDVVVASVRSPATQVFVPALSVGASPLTTGPSGFSNSVVQAPVQYDGLLGRDSSPTPPAARTPRPATTTNRPRRRRSRLWPQGRRPLA